MKRIALYLIKLYQFILSPDHGILKRFFNYGSGCRFYPTCSEYTYASFEKYGFFKGLPLSLKRLSKCHPWNDGGYDPLN